MKNKILIVLLIVLATNINAQVTNPIKKIGFGLEVFTNSTIEVLKNDGSGDTDHESYLRDKEIAKFCLSGQVYISYKINQKMTISVGLGYQNTGNKTKEETPIWITPDSGFDPSLPKTLKEYYNHHNIQIPIFYNYNITRTFYLRGGISTIINISNSTTQILGDNSGNKTRNKLYDFSSPNFRRLNFSGTL